MNINIVAKDTSVYENFKERCEKKLSKLDKFFGEEADATVTVSNQNGRETVEVMVKAMGMFFRAEKTSQDRLDSLEAVVDALTKQIVKNKKKLSRKIQGARFDDIEPEIPEEEKTEAESESYGIVRTKRFEVNCMDAQEAILEMNMLGHSFFLFRNDNTDEINVVYKREDGNYGVLIPE